MESFLIDLFGRLFSKNDYLIVGFFLTAILFASSMGGAMRYAGENNLPNGNMKKWPSNQRTQYRGYLIQKVYPFGFAFFIMAAILIVKGILLLMCIL